MLGPLVAILSALSFSFSDVAVRRGVVRLPVAVGAFITVLIGVPLFTFAALVSGQLFRLGDLALSSYGLLAAAGLVHYVVGRYFNYAAIQAIGAARAGPIQAVSLPYSVFVAWLFLDEGITAGMAAGIALILAGPFVIVETRRGSIPVPVPAAGAAPSAPVTVATTPAQEGFQLRQAEGYAFATIAALSYGSSPVLIRAALEDASGLSVLGGLVSYVAAAAVLIVSLLLPGRRGLLAAVNFASARTFFAAGFFVWLAQMLRFVALSLASVAVVTTLLRFTNMFTLMMSWLLNRELERITWRVVLGMVLSIAGAILLVLTRAD